ncbi:MAG: TIGR00282 family metallophosphoesterase [Proteobacteria bacterium]|nr:TIGR00282 family metallophosphoesterase [Pseudomonadota bacterium]
MKVLFIGDIIGKAGRRAVKELVPGLKNKHSIDIVIANGENAAGGFGIIPKLAEELFSYEVDLITSGNHIWDKKEIYPYLDCGAPLIRPGNYPAGNPGKGSYLLETPVGERLSVINASGRVFMAPIDCPFKYLEKEIEAVKTETKAILVDFHAEATSEKRAMGLFLDGKVSCVVGTHTHIQTADEKVSSKATGYITDVGMTGGTDSVIGVKAEEPILKFLTGMPAKFETANNDIELQGVVLEINSTDGKCLSIKRVKEPLNG